MQRTLQPFDEATILNEGNRSSRTLTAWFPTLAWLLDSIDLRRQILKEEADDHVDEAYWILLEASTNASWYKIEEYWRKASDSPAYYAAMILDPCQRKMWFKQEWENDPVKSTWLTTEVEVGVKELWESEYKGKYGKAAPTPGLPFRAANYTNKQGDDDDQFGGLQASMAIRANTSSTTLMNDQLLKYWDEDLSELEHPLDWWNRHYQSLPDLARMAYDMLSIPLMSDECERTFSSAKHLISDARNRLKIDIVEANECLKQWYGVPVKDTAPSGERTEVEALTSDCNDLIDQLRKAAQGDTESAAVNEAVDSDIEDITIDEDDIGELDMN